MKNKAFKMVFGIGYQRSGTTSFAQFFQNNGYKTVNVGGGIAKKMTKNDYCKMSNVCRYNCYNNEKTPLLTNGWCRQYDGVFDFGISAEVNGPSFVDDTSNNSNGNNRDKYKKECFKYSSFHQYQYDLLSINRTKWFEIIDSQYYNCSIFILNIRKINNWVRSRSEFLNKHLKGKEYLTLCKDYQNKPINDRTKSDPCTLCQLILFEIENILVLLTIIQF